MLKGYAWRERREWEKLAWQTAHLINISGKTIKRRVKPTELLDGKSGSHDPIAREEALKIIREKLSRRKDNGAH